MSLCWLFAGPVGALTFEYTDGTKTEGEIVRPTAKSLQIRTPDNKYVEIEWGKLSQTSLVELQKIAEESRNTRLLENVEPYIEIPEDEIIKRTEVTIKPVPRLERPAKGSLLGSMFKSSVGIVCLLLLYAANIYAGYEIATIRAYAPAVVCGVAAVAPVIGPVVFLCLPTKMDSHHEEEEFIDAGETGTPSAGYAVPGETVPGTGMPPEAATATTPGHRASGAVPQTQVFKRGQFTFNRRFVETKFASFFGAVRRGPDKEMVLLVKSARGEFIANRITRVAANDMHIEALKGSGVQEIQIPFAEIQELHLKHRDA